MARISKEKRYGRPCKDKVTKEKLTDDEIRGLIYLGWSKGGISKRYSAWIGRVRRIWDEVQEKKVAHV
jgi:hypothetical protein